MKLCTGRGGGEEVRRDGGDKYKKVYRNNVFSINPSVSFADSSLYTREPKSFIKTYNDAV